MGSCLSSPAAEDQKKPQGATTGAANPTKTEAKATIGLTCKHPKSSLKGTDAIALASARVKQLKAKHAAIKATAAASSGGEEPLKDINNGKSVGRALTLISPLILLGRTPLGRIHHHRHARLRHHRRL